MYDCKLDSSWLPSGLYCAVNRFTTGNCAWQAKRCLLTLSLASLPADVWLEKTSGLQSISWPLHTPNSARESRTDTQQLAIACSCLQFRCTPKGWVVTSCCSSRRCTTNQIFEPPMPDPHSKAVRLVVLLQAGRLRDNVMVSV